MVFTHLTEEELLLTICIILNDVHTWLIGLNMHLLNAMLPDLSTYVKWGNLTVSFFFVKTPIIVYLLEVEGNARNWAIIFFTFKFGDTDHVVVAVLHVKEFFVARLCVFRTLIL